MAAAQILRVTHSVENRVMVVDDKVTAVGNKMKDMDDKMGIVLNGMPDVLVTQDPTLIQTLVRREGCESSSSRHELSVIKFSLWTLASLTYSQGTN